MVIYKLITNILLSNHQFKHLNFECNPRLNSRIRRQNNFGQGLLIQIEMFFEQGKIFFCIQLKEKYSFSKQIKAEDLYKLQGRVFLLQLFVKWIELIGLLQYFFSQFMLKIFISLLILYRTLRCYPTTITYNYEAHPIMKTDYYYICYTEYTEQQRQVYYYSHYWVYFGQTYVKPKCIVSIASIVEIQKRHEMNFSISVTRGPTYLDYFYVNFTDYGYPLTKNICQQILLRFFIYDQDSLPGIEYKLWSREDIRYTQIKQNLTFSILPWTGQVVIAAFIFEIKCDLRSTKQFDVKLDFSYNPGDPHVQVSIQSNFSIYVLSSKSISAYIVVILNAFPIIVQKQVLNSLTNPIFINGTLKKNMHFFMGLNQFKINKTNYIEFNTSSQSILFPNKTSQSETNYDALKFTDIRDMNPPNLIKYDFELSKVLSFSLFNTTFILIYENIPYLGDIQLSQITTNQSSKIKIQNVVWQGNSLIVFCSSAQEIKNFPIELQLNWKIGQVKYKAVSTLTLTIVPSQKTQIIIWISEILQYIYLGIFVLSLLNNKTIGIQLMSLIQLTYYSQIPIGIIHDFFVGLGRMKYVSGYNLKFPFFKQGVLSYNFQVMGFSSNFMSNFNVMMIPVFLCPIMSFILFVGSRISNSYKFKPRLMYYSVTALCEWSFALLAFSCYNIFTSFVIDVQSLGKQDLISLFVSIIVATLPLVFNIIYFFLHKYYKEFISYFDQSQVIFSLPVQKSKLIRNLYPCVLSFQIIVFPVLLATQVILNYSLYIILVITVLCTIYIGLTMPYFQRLNNIRLLIHRSLIILMVIFLIICKAKVNIFMDSDVTILNLVWIIFLILILAIILNLSYIIWSLVIWFKKAGIIDMKLYLQTYKNATKKSATVSSGDPQLYPILEYGIGRQNLLDRENEKSSARINLSNIKDMDSSKNAQRKQIDQKLKEEMIQ